MRYLKIAVNWAIASVVISGAFIAGLLARRRRHLPQGSSGRSWAELFRVFAGNVTSSGDVDPDVNPRFQLSWNPGTGSGDLCARNPESM